jgi:truncated hemoglobin YjbI
MIIVSRGNGGTATWLTCMSKTTKALKKQAATSQLIAQRVSDPAVARQMTTLAEAFRAQAAALKKKNKKKK